jgi:hypothetical protein
VDGVLLPQPEQDGADAAAQERLFVLHQVSRTQVTDQRPRADGVAEVVRGGDGDHADATHLEQVRRPETGLHHREVQQRVLGADQPHDALRHDQSERRCVSR